MPDGCARDGGEPVYDGGGATITVMRYDLSTREFIRCRAQVVFEDLALSSQRLYENPQTCDGILSGAIERS